MKISHTTVATGVNDAKGRRRIDHPYGEPANMKLNKNIIFDILDAIPQLWETVELKTDVLISKGYIPVKSRDPREPKRAQKVKTERLLRDLFTRRFTRQLEQLRYGNSIQYKAKKKPLPPPLPPWEEEEWIEELFSVIFSALKYGVELFGEEISVGIDYTMSNVHALNHARTYTYDLIKGIDETTGEIIQSAISAFVDQPGFNIGDIINQLVETGMTETRAARIAVTETTRAFAEGQKEAGRELREEFPGMKIEKTWFTNNDDRVCDICGPLDGKSILYEEEFDNGDPPAHVNCRCWLEYNTRIND